MLLLREGNSRCFRRIVANVDTGFVLRHSRLECLCEAEFVNSSAAVVAEYDLDSRFIRSHGQLLAGSECRQLSCGSFSHRNFCRDCTARQEDLLTLPRIVGSSAEDPTRSDTIVNVVEALIIRDG